MTTRDSRLGLTLPTVNQPIKDIMGMAKDAEIAGFDMAWNYEAFRNPLIMQAHFAGSTNRIALGTGIMATPGRSPYVCANSAADIDELCDGRFTLGIGIGTGRLADILNGAKIDHPVDRIREYIEVYRLAWNYIASGIPEQFEGKYYNFNTPAKNPFGSRTLRRENVPLYLGCLRTGMSRLAGEVADGAIGYMMSIDYVEQIWVPAIRDGALKAGKNLSDVEITLQTLCSVSENRNEAIQLAKTALGTYLCNPTASFIADHAGLAEDRNAVVKAFREAGPKALPDSVSDELLRTFAIAGTEDECREQIAKFQQCVDQLILHLPYLPPVSPEQSLANFRSTLNLQRR